MHIAASNPISLNLDSLDPKIIDKEKQVLLEQAISSGKPKDIAEKIVEGRVRKFCEEKGIKYNYYNSLFENLKSTWKRFKQLSMEYKFKR